MKFMMNGAVTLGTMDGANIEIFNQVGEENIYIFGATVEDLGRIRPTYNPYEKYERVHGLKRVVDSLVDGTFSDDGSGMFRDLHSSLLDGSSWEKGDVYYVLGDFEDYRRVKDLISEDYLDRKAWNKKCWINICKSGKFSSDRTIREYARDIWHIEPKQLEE